MIDGRWSEARGRHQPTGVGPAESGNGRTVRGLCGSVSAFLGLNQSDSRIIFPR
jgi:hypothetical protein